MQKEAAAAELQKSMDRALEEKLKIQEEIEKLNKMGDAAGKKQVGLGSHVASRAIKSEYLHRQTKFITGWSLPVFAFCADLHQRAIQPL